MTRKGAGPKSRKHYDEEEHHPLARTERKRKTHPHSDAEALSLAKQDLAEGASAKTAASYFVHEVRTQTVQVGVPRCGVLALAVTVCAHPSHAALTARRRRCTS